METVDTLVVRHTPNYLAEELIFTVPCQDYLQDFPECKSPEQASIVKKCWEISALSFKGVS